MDSYLIGALLIEAFFFLTQSTSSYLEMIPVRLLIYGLALVMFYPVAARFARERKARAGDVPSGEAVPAPTDALAVHLPENITVYYRPAPLSARLGALGIDVIVVCALAGVWCFGVAILSQIFRGQGFKDLALTLGLVLPPLGYFLYMEATNDGQTLGKRHTGIRAIHESGRALSVGEVFARNILRPLMVLPPFNLIEALCIRTNGWRQRLGDLAAGSVVIIDPK